jgi:regulator of sigma E protease
MITALAFLVTLGVLIVVHEYGHYQVARWCGVKVLKFSVGFGKNIWSRQRSPDHTEFALAMIPLGGYVRMLDEREGNVPAAQLSQAFNRKTLWQRTAIVSAGPIANLLLAVLLYATAQWIGVSEAKAVLSAPVAGSLAEQADLRSGDLVQAVSDDGMVWRDVASMSDLMWAVNQNALQGQALHLRVVHANAAANTSGRGARTAKLALDRLPTRDMDAALVKRIGLGAPFSVPVLGVIKAEGAAQAAGLREGDRVLRVDGAPMTDAAMLVQRIRASADKPMAWTVQRTDDELNLTVRPRAVTDTTKPGSAGASDPVPASIGRIDAAVGAAPAMVTVQRGLFEGLSLGVVRTWEVSSLTVRMLGRMLIGQASIKNLSGPLTIADVAGQSAKLGVAYYLGFLALVSVSLGVLNLLPLPMLDGGHLMYYLFEAVTGRPVSDAWTARLQRGGFFVLLLMMTIALSNDVTRFLGL